MCGCTRLTTVRHVAGGRCRRDHAHAPIHWGNRPRSGRLQGSARPAATGVAHRLRFYLASRGQALSRDRNSHTR